MQAEINQFFGTVGSIAGVGSILDAVIAPKHKNVVAAYLFGLNNRPFRQFEAVLIEGLMSPFIKGTHLNWKRLYVYSLFSSIAYFIFIYLQFSSLPPLSEWYFSYTISIISLAFAISIGSLPLDYFSFYITKQFFIKNRPNFPRSIVMVVADLMVSSLPYISIIAIIIILFPIIFPTGLHKTILSSIFASIAVSAIGSVFITIIQIIVIFASLVVRFLMIITHLNGLLALNSRLLSFPFTFVSLLVGLTLALL